MILEMQFIAHKIEQTPVNKWFLNIWFQFFSK